VHAVCGIEFSRRTVLLPPALHDRRTRPNQAPEEVVSAFRHRAPYDEQHCPDCLAWRTGHNIEFPLWTNHDEENQ
jgi:hypothetical protein